MSRVNSLSTTPGLIPKPEKLNIAQIAINASDGKIYIKLLNGQVICVGQDITKFASAEIIEEAIDSIDLTPYALTETVTASLNAIAQQLQALSQAIIGKAEQQHSHNIPDIANLGETLSAMQAGINGKQPVGEYVTLPILTQGLAGKASIGGVTGAFSVGGTCTVNVLNSSNHISAGTQYRIGTNAVIKAPQQQGWQNPTGQTSTATFNTNAVTLTELAKRVAAIQSNLIYHGLLSTQGATIV